MDQKKKRMTKILIAVSLIALVSIILAQFYTLFVSVTMFVFAILCFMLSYMTYQDKKSYDHRLVGWDQVMSEKEIKMVKQEKRAYKIRVFVFILLGLILIWTGITTLV